MQCLQRLKKMKLCHRHITLHNLLLVETTTTTTTTNGDGDTKATTNTAKQVKLSNHGWALNVTNSNGTNPTPMQQQQQQQQQQHMIRLPPPPCTIPLLYVPPELMNEDLLVHQQPSNGDNSHGDNITKNDDDSSFLYGMDLWSAAICLLLLLVGSETPLFAAPVPEDARFVHLHTGLSQKAKAQQWSPALLELLQGMLQPNPRQRWTLEQVVQHEWLTTTTTTQDDGDSEQPHPSQRPKLA
jgi:serine/threonine protein kinase